MKKRIFRSVFLTAVFMVIASVALTVIMFNRYMINSEWSRLENEAEFAAAGVETGGMDYLNSIRTSSYRITLIRQDGKVLFDNQQDPSSMENHSSREEVAQALSEGTGRSERISSTLQTRTMYYACRIADGSVIRVAVTSETILHMLLGMTIVLILILICAVIASAYAANRISARIVTPINQLDLSCPLKNEVYPEIHPLLERINNQNHQIDEQMGELRRRQKEFATITNAISESLILFDKEGSVISANAASKGIFHVVHRVSDLPDPAMATVSTALQGRRKSDVLLIDDRKLQVDASPITSEEKIIGASMLSWDITEQYDAEEVRREFTANVSHELKTPLQSIMGSAELLENHMVKPQDTDVFIHRIRSEASRLLTLIDDIIRLSQLDENGPLEEETVSLKAVAKEAVSALKQSAAEHKVQIHLDAEDVKIHGNMRLIYEIAYNLIDNAIRYNREGGQVFVTVCMQEEQPVLLVEDTGIGIPQQSLPRIFERFYRVDKSHSRKNGGTGLGLSIVKHAVERSHGTIHVESQLGKGTKFTVQLENA